MTGNWCQIKLTLAMSLGVLFLFLVAPLYAGSALLTHIGGLSTTAQYPQWWYVSPNPVIGGQTAPTTDVVVVINGVSQTVISDAQGAWSVATTMDAGDHSVSLQSGDLSYAFTLTIGSLPETVSTGTSSSQELPAAGNSLPTLLAAGAGFLFLIVGTLRLATQKTS